MNVCLPSHFFWLVSATESSSRSSGQKNNNWIQGMIQKHRWIPFQKRVERNYSSGHDRPLPSAGKHFGNPLKSEARIEEKDDNSNNNETETEDETLNVVSDDSFRPSIAERKKISNDSSWPLLILGALPPGLRDGKIWGRTFASVAQLGLGFYLAFALWKTASEVIEEFMQEISGVENSGFTRDQVSTVIRLLELPPGEAKAELERTQMDNTAGISPYMPTLNVAQKLALAGLPLRSNSHQVREPKLSGSITKPSVEAVLLSLTRTEALILQQCLWTPQTKNLQQGRNTAWRDIVGLDSVKEGLLTCVRMITGSNPSQAYESLFDHSPSCAGVLLYGPPGCGKSFLIKALSTQSSLPCLVVTPSVLLRKYVGETNQQCRALFALAQKLAPCILCIDEVDGLFRERSEAEHEVSRDLKTEFLQHLDGMMTSSSVDASGKRRRNLVIAATNRPFDVDSAILRRLTQSHLVDMPDVAGRSLILQHLLKSVPTDPTMDLSLLSTRTEGYSPSDLRQLLQEAAASGPLRENPTDPPPLTTEHVLQAMRSVPPTTLSPQYRWALMNFAQSQHSERFNQHLPAFNSRDLTPGGRSLENTHLNKNNPTVTRWETDQGNFYHLGNIQVDSVTFDKLVDLAQIVMESQKDEDGGDMDNDEDEDNDDL